MLCSRKWNNLINKLHKRGLKLTYRDEIKYFQQILRKQNKITIHERNWQFLMKKVCKIVNGIASPIINSISHAIKIFRNFLQKIGKPWNMATKQWRIELCFSGRIYTLIKNTKSLNNFQWKVKAWQCEFWLCIPCKNYVQNLGFI